jgi:hypothetical protein
MRIACNYIFWRNYDEDKKKMDYRDLRAGMSGVSDSGGMR